VIIGKQGSVLCRLMKGKLSKYFGTLWLLVYGSLVLLLLAEFVVLPVRAADEPEINLEPIEGKLSDKIEVTGSGFEAGAYFYMYFSSDAAVIGDSIGGQVSHYKLLERNIRSSEESDLLPGEFETYFRIPEVLDDGDKIEDVHGGEYYVYVTYRVSNKILAAAILDVWPGEIELHPDTATVGSEVEINGDGLRPEQQITIEYNGQAVSMIGGVTKTNSEGGLNCAIVVPESPAGDYVITAIDESGNRPEATLRVKPQIVLSPDTQDIDNTVRIEGTGFRSRERITITLDGVEVPSIPTSLHTTRLGSLGGSFVVPHRPAYTEGYLAVVRVLDESDHMAEAELAVSPIQATVRLLPNTSAASPGCVGMELNLTGIWFVANAAITITYGDGELITVATTEASDSRNFAAAFRVPPSRPGVHTVFAGDGTNSISTVFTMEAEKPLTPVPILPTFAATVEPETRFDWDDVTDPSGVSYILQIATDSGFSNVVMEKIDLSDSEYVLAGEEVLTAHKEGSSYYWRVKSIDGTYIESDWTVSRPFYIGTSQGATLPGWAKYLGIGIGAALVSIFVMRARRRVNR
jgi:hypothetical protein